jgi:hypothetical protein
VQHLKRTAYTVCGALEGLAIALTLFCAINVVNCGFESAAAIGVLIGVFAFPITIGATIAGGMLGFYYQRRTAFTLAGLLALGAVTIAAGNVLPHTNTIACRIDL